MTKLAWQLISNPEKLWVKIMNFKYNCGSFGMPSVINKPNASNAWRAIVNSWDAVVRNSSWVIRDGSDTRFWRDSWIPNNDSLESLPPSASPIAELNFPVSFYATNTGWN